MDIENIWNEIDKPILDYCANFFINNTFKETLDIKNIADNTKIDYNECLKSVFRLKEKYIRIRQNNTMAKYNFIIESLTASGWEAVGAWNS